MLICLLVISRPVTGHLVCITADGQIQIQSACCSDHFTPAVNYNASATYPITVDSMNSEDSCSPCIDILISISTDVLFISARTNAVPERNPVLIASSISLPPFTRLTDERLLSPSPPDFKSTSPFLKTVILRC